MSINGIKLLVNMMQCSIPLFMLINAKMMHYLAKNVLIWLLEVFLTTSVLLDIQYFFWHRNVSNNNVKNLITSMNYSTYVILIIYALKYATLGQNCLFPLCEATSIDWTLDIIFGMEMWLAIKWSCLYCQKTSTYLTMIIYA